MDRFNVKLENLEQLSEYRKSIIHNPPLRNLFLELTLRCNERCIHCGSSCGEFNNSSELSLEQYKKILDDVNQDFDISKIKLDITGGEPLLRKDLFEIMGYANKLGYIWGMTSNGTLIDDEIAKKLQKCGMRTIAISIDGLEKTHDRLRGRKGAYKSAMNGVKALIKNRHFEHIQITTVINHQTINELPIMFEILMNTGINSWRIINIEPMGRAKEDPELALSSDKYRSMFDFIRLYKRKTGAWLSSYIRMQSFSRIGI